MLGEKNRLRKNRDFRFVYRRGRNLAYKRVAMMYVSGRAKDELLIGFSVSRKVAKAHERNRIKRLMRENVRLIIGEIKEGHRIIFIARDAANGSSYEEIGSDIKSLLQKAKLLADS